MRRNRKGQFRINYFERLFPLWMMIFTASLARGLQLGADFNARASETLGAEMPQVVVHEQMPSPTPQLQVVEKVVFPTATPTPTDKEAIIAEIVRVFGEDAPEAFNVLYCENRGLRPDAENWNRNGTWDAGIFQINQIHGHSIEDMKDYKKNIQVAKKIFDNRGWTAWACSERVGVKPFWK